MKPLRNFEIQQNDRGVLTAVLNVPDRPVNVFEDSVLLDLHEIVQHVQSDGGKTIKFVVFRSGKPTGFLAGADIHRLQSLNTREEAAWILEQGQKLFNAIEQLPVPTLAVIHGACMGGGLEFAMACRYRLAVNDANTKLALPEVKLGLIPAWGGTQRLPRKVGLMAALPMVLEGKTLSAKKALKSGLVDGLIASPTSEQEINDFISQRLQGRPLAGPQRTWLQWAVESNPLGRSFALKKAREGVAKYAKQYPALHKIIGAVEAGLPSPTVSETGLKAERDAFTDLLFGDVAPNLIGIFLNQEKAKKTSTWTDKAEGQSVKKIAVIGAGTMGAGIAQLAASRGLEVILQDVKDDFVQRGMETCRGLFSKAASKGAMTQAEADAGLARLHPRVNWGPSDDIGLMIEAVVEKPEIKASIFKTADELLSAGAVLASNTSALPIDDMARATRRPGQVAGLHFFNPVHKMPLVEVVRAPQSSDDAIATLVGVAKKLGKVPVVVKQSPGFLVNRILFPYLDEAARLVAEGYPTKDIDKAAKKFGMPMGPLELLDVVGIDVALDVSKTLSPLSNQETPTPELFQRMVEAGLKGQKTGKGFYEWKDGQRGETVAIPGVEARTPTEVLPDWTAAGEKFDAIQQRLALSMVNEAAKCLAEEIVTEPWMVDLGMVLGTGFAPFRGGPMKCIEHWGEGEVTERLKLMSSRLGRRFEPATGPSHLKFVPRAKAV
jgi:3-hydroxyacyl-CoA dehydrogenase/enoyl-CoA hydratase/3-hydroxybutyryl-CoA epimerase